MPRQLRADVRYRKAKGSVHSGATTDSQLAGQLRTKSAFHGICELEIERQGTSMDASGHSPRGLQNCLRGAAEASWVGSIPIHPRHLSVISLAHGRLAKCAGCDAKIVPAAFTIAPLDMATLRRRRAQWS